ncbi:MAG TPA: DUF3060 domain-containing protein [Galbitalea sp.]|nr:DUF3060 domain-containing protein [Galbitalea sp.]
MKKLVLACSLAVAAILLTGCSTLGNPLGGAPAATPTPTAGVVACVNGEADYTTSNTKNTLGGACAKVVISGKNITLTAADVSHLIVSGDKNTINAAVLSDATIVGTSNVVKTTTVGPLTVSGNSNTVTVLGPIGYVVVTGANDTITTPGTIGTITQSGIGNKIGAP